MVNNTDNHDDAALEQRSRELFNEQVANLDGRTRSRLNQARQAALDAARGDRKFAGMRWLLPAGSVAALALVAMVSWEALRPGADAPLQPVIASSVDDLEIITADEELELLQNMDFYAWLDSQEAGLTEAEPAGEAG